MEIVLKSWQEDKFDFLEALDSDTWNLKFFCNCYSTP